MGWTAPEITRTDQPCLGDERTMLEAGLDYHRQTLLMKCAGLAAEQLKLRSVQPSSLSLLGLVRHLAGVERWWFRRNFAGQQLDDLYSSEASPDGEFDDLDQADAEADFALYAAEVDLARQATVGRSLDETFLRATHVLLPGRPRVELSLRWVYIHMLEEYARHNGHADLIRQRIDGATGP